MPKRGFINYPFSCPNGAIIGEGDGINCFGEPELKTCGSHVSNLWIEMGKDCKIKGKFAKKKKLKT